MYEAAADHETRLNTIATQIALLGHDVVMIQEAQEDKLPLFKEKLDGRLYFLNLLQIIQLLLRLQMVFSY